MFNHGFSLYSQEVHVPLLIISPEAPAGRTCSEPVSLRDLPATIADLTGLVSGSPFPGRSVADCWREASDPPERFFPRALSEVDIPMVIIPQRGRGPKEREFTISAVTDGFHYIVDVQGTEELFELAADPRRRATSPRCQPTVRFLGNFDS